MDKKIFDFEQKLMLEEYKKVQDSAEHHDHMAWLMSSVLVVASVTLLGFLVSSMDKINPFLILLGCVAGFILIVVNMTIFSNSQEIKIRKYMRCKKLEEKINSILKEKEIDYQMENHLMKGPSRSQRYLYFMALWTIALSFIILALFVICFCC